MRVDANLRQSVVFLGRRGNAAIDEASLLPTGVGFLVLGRSDQGGGTYLVTARHVAERTGVPFAIRFNKQSSGSELVELEAPLLRWFCHPDESVDLAVAAIDMPNGSDHTRYHLDDVIKTEPIRAETGAGDGVYIAGMFYYTHGSKRNLPVIYRGSVALVPGDDLIPVEGGRRVEGYLVEANPISGSSGAPVWVSRATMIRLPQAPPSEPLTFFAEGKLTLLGFWMASWKVPGAAVVGAGGPPAPLGMGIVISASKLIDIFNDTEVAQARSEAHRRGQTET
jgi:hypothetical protein